MHIGAARDESVGAAPGWCIMAAYIVGTPSKMVTLSRAIIGSASAGSNRGSRVRQAPVRTAVFSRDRSGRRVEQGQGPEYDVVRPAWSRSRVTSTFPTRLKWVSSAPLGVPVVPDV